jgi:hypothetical protein
VPVSLSTSTTYDCPCSIWSNAAAPLVPDEQDSSSIEVGVKFTSDTNANAMGIRFYKGPSNGGAHVGSLWTSSGTLLGRATFANETASGWQQVSFSAPVPITAGTTYVASYHAPGGQYAYDPNYFTSAGVDNFPLHALKAGVAGADGVYVYSSSPAFPSGAYADANYWVDVVLSTSGTAPTATPTLTPTVTPTVAGATNTPTSTPVPTSTVASSSTPTASATATPMAGGCPCSIWSGAATPTTADQADGGSVELGVKFRSDTNGSVTGLRFYKGPRNGGTHVGSLWTSGGTLLASATFTNETASGWQQVSFSSPVSISANTTYVASYHAPGGQYAIDATYFTSSGVDNAPLHALQSGVDGGNGAYVYTSSTTFPNNTYIGSNYWVDVVFTQ